MIPSSDSLSIGARAAQRIGPSADTMPIRGAQTLTAPHDTLLSAADTLAPTAETFRAAPPPPASAADLFGPDSYLVEQIAQAPDASAALTQDPIFQGTILLIAAALALLLHSNASDARFLLGNLSPKRTTQQRAFENRGVIYNHFLNLTGALGYLFIGVLTVKLCDRFAPQTALASWSDYPAEVLFIGATAVAALLGAFQRTVLRIAGEVTLNRSFVSSILYVKQIYFALTVLTVSPLILLCALSAKGSESVLLSLIALVAAMIILLFLKEIRTLFVGKNLSNLHWILYLCTVEIVPISFVVLFLLKHN